MRKHNPLLHVLINLTARLVAWSLFGVFFRIERRGREHVPRTGGVLVVSNHISWFDPPLLNIALPRIPHWLAMAELFGGRFWRWFFTHGGLIPIDRDHPGSAPLKEAIRRLREGHVLVLFPEGGIHREPNTVLGGNPDIKQGAALIALKAGAPIVPAIIQNARIAYRWQDWFFRRHRIRLTFGEPFRLPPNADRTLAHSMIREKLLALAGTVKSK